MDVSALQTDDIETTSVRRATLYRAFGARLKEYGKGPFWTP